MKRTLLALIAALVLFPAAAFGLNGAVVNFVNGLTTTVTTVGIAPGTLFWVQCYNPAAAVSYVQIFDTTGAVTLGTTPPTVAFGFPASSSQLLSLDMGISNGIKVAATTTPNGNVAPATALVCGFGRQ